MRKLWMLAAANIKKTKSASATLVIMFIVAALLLNAGLLVTMSYGGFFDRLKDELNASDAYFMVPDLLYSEDVARYFNENEHVNQLRQNDALVVGAHIWSQGENKSFTVLFQNMDTERDTSKWKFVGEHLPAGEMSVYVPDVFKAVSGYQLNDKIKLTYTDEYGRIDGSKTLEFTVKGYTEDIFFSSTDTGLMGFYLTGDTYNRVSEILDSPVYREHLVFTSLDEVANSAKVENGLRELLSLNSASLISGDPASMLVLIDIDLIGMSRTMMATVISAMMVVFAAIIVIVCLLVCRFRIVNSLEDDLVKIGSLKSAGYTSGQIKLSVLLQFGCIAALGSLIGVALSYPVLPAVALVLEQQSGLKWEQGFDAAISSAAFLLLLGIVILVAWAAARHVKKLSPIHALRGETGAHKYRHNRLPLEKAASPLPVALALKSLLQGVKQNLMIFVIVTAVAFAGAFGVIMYYNSSVDTTAFAKVPGMELPNVMANLNPEMDHTDAISEIKAMAHVRKLQYYDETKLKVDGSDVSCFLMADYAGKETDVVYEGHYPKEPGEIVLAGIVAKRLDKKIGDTVTVQFGTQTQTMTVSGFSGGMSMGGINASMLAADFLRLNPDFTPQDLYIYLDKGTDAAEFIAALEARFDGSLLKGTLNGDKALAEGMISYQNIVALMGLVMLVITLLVIALVLYFVISSSVIRRKRELGIQKAVGYTTTQLMNQIALGFAFPVLVGVALGCVLGVVYTNLLMTVAMGGMVHSQFIADPVWITVFGAATFVFAYLLSLLVTWRIRKISAYALVTE